jgi:large repetitive protein
VSFGGENREAFTVTVTGGGGVLPTGTVRIKDGGIELCSTNVFTRKASGVVSATCRLSDLELNAGSYSVKAFYSGNDRYNASTSKAATFVVDRDSVTIKISESRTTVSVGDESQAVFTASLTTGDGESDPNGETVTVHLGTTSCIVTLSNDTGTCTIGNRALRVGSYTVSASYGGDLNLASSTATSSTPLLVGSGSTVPVVPAGKAWSGQLYWWVFGDMALIGLALFEFARRGLRFRAFRAGGGRRSPRHLASSSGFLARSR